MVLAVSAVTLAALAGVPTLAAPEYSTVAVDKDVGRFASEHVAQQLGTYGFHVVTAKEMGALIGAERERQLLNCDSSGCLAELGDALGAEGIILGELARLGKHIQLNVKVVGSRGTGTRASFSKRLSGDDQLLEALDEAAKVLAEQLGAPRVEAVASASGPSRLRAPVIALGAVALVGLAGGGVLTAQAAAVDTSLRAPLGAGMTPYSPQQTADLVARGKGLQLGSALAYGVGAAAAVASIALFAVGPGTPAAPTVTALAGPQGFGVFIGGAFP